MNLHEFQAKELVRQYGVPTPRGTTVETLAGVEAAAASLGGNRWVVKAQIHAGGRGKAGGVRVADSAAALEAAAASLLGQRLVTVQNAPNGQTVSRLLLEETLDIAREFYVSLVLDRERERIVVVASGSGGMEIEELARTRPEKILREVCDPLWGLQDFQCRSLGFALGLEGKALAAFGQILRRLYALFKDCDLSLLEVNPLAMTRSGDLVVLDCKINIDDNALYRHQTLAQQRDSTQEDEKEAAAHAAGLNYIALDGNIGCMVNGAGLAMATMDLIKLHGGMPANFLDVGGGATAQTVAAAFKIIQSDAHVKAVLVNIFGGIMRCDIIAEGLIQAVREVRVNVPVIVRLEGTHRELGRKMLAESGLSIVSASGLTDAAERAVAAAA